MSEKRRFGETSEEEMLKKRKYAIPRNTQKNNAMASELLRQYLQEKEAPINFEEFSETELAQQLCHFYLDARTKSGELYKATTFENIRYSLNRYLKSPPHVKQYDIITSSSFTEANECFKAALTEIKKAGKGDVQHYPMILHSDLNKLYHSIFMTPDTPTGLLNRVQMNIRLFFCRRANESMEKMTKGTFVVSSYEDGTRYVVKAVDELTKNHRANDNELISGHMPEEKENVENCPVETFQKYISKLNPACDRLWQYAKESFEESDETWFQNRPIGRDSLAKFMQTLSKKVPLSQMYTNHSVRVTGSLLSQSNFSPAQIMAVTGHKSVSSLSVYQKVTDREKQAMGSIIRQSTMPSLHQPALPAPNMYNALPAPASTVVPPRDRMLPVPSNVTTPMSAIATTSNAVVQFEGINIEDLFSDFDDSTSVRNRQVSMNVQCQKTAPVFHGCSLSNVTVHINYTK